MKRSHLRRVALGVLAASLVAWGGPFATSAPLPPPPISVGTITGNVIPKTNPDGSFITSPANQIVFLTRDDVPTTQFQRAAISNSEGEYRFDRVPAGFTYRLNSPVFFENNGCGAQMLLNSTGPVPPTPLPAGLLLPPGSTSDIDLKQPPGCQTSPSGQSVTSVTVMPANIAAAGLALMFGHDDEPLVPSPAYVRMLSPGNIFTVEDPNNPNPVQPPLNDEVRTTLFIPYGRMAVDVTLTLEHISHPSKPTTTASGRSAIVFTGDPLEDGEVVRVSVDPDQPALAAAQLISPSSHQFTYVLGQMMPFFEFTFAPSTSAGGRVFVDIGEPNDLFDGADAPLPGVELAIWDFKRGPPPANPPLATTTTDTDGTYQFHGLANGYYLVQVMVGEEPRRSTVILAISNADPDADPFITSGDFAYLPDDAPHLPISAGDLHEATVEVSIPVGSVAGPLDFVAVLWDSPSSSELFDVTYGSLPIPFSGPLTGDAGVIDVENVSVEAGVARVRLHLVAQGVAFPLDFFGSPARHIELYIAGTDVSFVTPFRAENLPVGAVLDPAGGSSPLATLTVLDTWGYGSWRAAHPLGAAVSTSTDPEPALNRVDVTVQVTTPAWTPNFLFADVAAGDQPFDAVFALFDGVPFTDGASGFAGAANLLSVSSTSPGTFLVHLRLDAGLRGDGNPAALDEVVYHVGLYLNAAAMMVDVDLTGPVAVGPHGSYTVTGFLNVLDRATQP